MSFLRKNKKKKTKNGLSRIDSGTTLIMDSPPRERKNKSNGYKEFQNDNKKSKCKYFLQEKKSKKKKKTKKSKNGFDQIESGTRLIFGSPTRERKKKKQSPAKIVVSANKDCNTLYQLANLKMGKEDQLLDDFLFQDCLERINDYQSQLNNLVSVNRLKKKMKMDVEHCLQQITDLLVFVNNSVKIGTEKKRKRKKKKKTKAKNELNLQIPSERIGMVTVNDSPKDQNKPQIGLIIPELTRQNSSEMFDDFFTNRQRRYSGSRLIKN
ncbi:gametogenetin-binding protein [Anaeramoeba flamelloides]|uniref:Gametogenetin-binding protein n=1 Tax=Anaeramoeba flamelloides TaxID=1746091 RepID=A0AAV7ZN41_9EUKA|nr:gametogenetin-binding protein [Anaeramoeba flamelloides]|eukprot:Anaeramoba_flamelloidesa1070231_43.p1 GENE.a1070231_43~~a1070231_43.p1  ORF type:complete len:267 (+),score=69.32 a1070231_43:23-823(+)